MAKAALVGGEARFEARHLASGVSNLYLDAKIFSILPLLPF